MTDRDKTSAEQRVGRPDLPSVDRPSGAPTMSDAQLIDALSTGALSPVTTCPCGVMRSIMPAFHRAATDHDCVHHPRRSCGTCRSADRMLAGVVARLRAEVEHGPFIVA